MGTTLIVYIFQSRMKSSGSRGDMDDDEETESVTGSSIAAPSSSLVKEGLSPIHALSVHHISIPGYNF